MQRQALNAVLVAERLGRPATEQYLSGLEIDGRRLAPAISLELVRDALILIEGAHARPLDGRDVDERVAAAIFRRDEAIALVIIEKFDGSGDHMGILVPRMTGMLQQQCIPAS